MSMTVNTIQCAVDAHLIDGKVLLLLQDALLIVSKPNVVGLVVRQHLDLLGQRQNRSRIIAKLFGCHTSKPVQKID